MIRSLIALIISGIINILYTCFAVKFGSGTGPMVRYSIEEMLLQYHTPLQSLTLPCWTV